MKKRSIVALLSQKGGVGKTTVTMQLAAGFARRHLRVAIGDLDPQESASRWAASANQTAPFPAPVAILRGARSDIERGLQEHAPDADLVLLDCPPSIEHAHTLTALELADVVLLPVVPSPTDLWSTRAVERLVVATMARRPILRAALLPNRVQRTGLAGDVLEVLREFELPVLDAVLAQRNAYAQSAVIGGSIYGLGRAAEAAREEVERLVTAVVELTGDGT